MEEVVEEGGIVLPKPCFSLQGQARLLSPGILWIFRDIPWVQTVLTFSSLAHQRNIVRVARKETTCNFRGPKSLLVASVGSKKASRATEEPANKVKGILF